MIVQGCIWEFSSLYRLEVIQFTDLVQPLL